VGVAARATCRKMPMKLVVALSISSHVLSFFAVGTLSRTAFLYSAQFVCGVCSRSAGFRTTIVVLMVTMMGV